MTDRFSMSPEQAAVFADEESAVNMTGGFHSLAAVFAGEQGVTDAFRNGTGIGCDHCNCGFHAASLLCRRIPSQTRVLV